MPQSQADGEKLQAHAAQSAESADVAQPPQSSVVTAPSSPPKIDGMLFEPQITAAGLEQSFLGGGTRYKMIIKVYMLGLYVDAVAAESALKPWTTSTNSVKELMDTDEFWRQLIAIQAPITLVFKLNMTVGADTFLNALDEALVKVNTPASAIAAFKEVVLLVTGDKIESGCTLSLAFRDGKMQCAKTLPKETAPSSAHALEGKPIVCEKLLDMYLGPAPDKGLVPKIRKSVADELLGRFYQPEI